MKTTVIRIVCISLMIAWFDGVLILAASAQTQPAGERSKQITSQNWSEELYAALEDNATAARSKPCCP